MLQRPSSSPFVLLGADVLRGVHGLLEQALRSWCAAWGVPGEDVVLETLRAWEATDRLPAIHSWQAPWRAAAGTLTPAWPADMPAQLQRLLFAPERQYALTPGMAAMAAATADAALQALLPALAAAVLPAGALVPESGPPPDTAWRRGTGAVLLAIRLGRQTCHVLCDHDAVQAAARQVALRGGGMPAALPPLPALTYRALLAALDVALPVELGRAEVDLGSVLRLEPGDVIRLDRPADHAICVRNSEGAPLFDGYLGLAGGQVALELLRHDATLGVKT